MGFNFDDLKVSENLKREFFNLGTSHHILD